MLLKSFDRTKVSFGSFSTPGTVNNSPFSNANGKIEKQYFSQENLQFVVNNIVDMFGYSQGIVAASVNDNDVVQTWTDANGNGMVDHGEIGLYFSMNANINTEARISTYGKNFMYQQALQYGNDIVFGIVAHEIGHMVTHNALNVISTQITQGRPAAVITQYVAPHWDELCADYLAGIVLAKINPPLNREPLKQFVAGTGVSESHPNGFWRSHAIEAGYLWAMNNNPATTSAVISNVSSQKQLLIDFFNWYWNTIFIPNSTRGISPLPNCLMMPTNYFLSYL